MEDTQNENQMDQARNSARRAVAKGERAAEAVADEAQNAGDDLKKLGNKAASRAKAAGENAYEEFSEAVSSGSDDVVDAASGAWSAVSGAVGDAWQATRKEVEKSPMRSTLIALAVGIVVGGLFSHRD